MPKQPRKFVAVKTCALACVAGLSLNTFAIAGGSAARTATESVRKSAGTLTPVPDPSPSPDRQGLAELKRPARGRLSSSFVLFS